MPYSAKILADSIGPNGVRLTTWELTYWRAVHSELLTHRLFSRNSASSRAIPTKKLMEQIRRDPAMPLWWGKNQAGMQARIELMGWRKTLAMWLFLQMRWVALFVAWTLSKIGLHKQIANRILEPWMFITVIVSSTEHENWFRLRCHPDAQPEIGWVARRMKELHDSSTPELLPAGAWHLPLIGSQDWDDLDDGEEFCELLPVVLKVSVARCARISYLTHDGRKDFREDVDLHNKLAASGHWSPFEHVAQAQAADEIRWSGNFRGWTQYRETMDPTFTRVGR